MKAKRATIAVAILLAGFGFATQDAAARTPDARSGKTSARAGAQAQTSGHGHTNSTARATSQRGHQHAAAASAATGRHAAGRRGSRNAYAGGYGGGYGGISCVPYARQVTGMTISGNGGQWWYNASGLYARGHRPEVGSVMAFSSSGGMRAGHVAVVERVVGQREVLIHHANWGGPGIRRGSIMHGVSVIDVSANNDWSQVRVQVGNSNENYGRTYAVYGFIHNRPDTGGTLVADNAPLRINAAHAASLGLEEVAEAAPSPRNRSRRR